jgi:hypothetical protein
MPELGAQLFGASAIDERARLLDHMRELAITQANVQGDDGLPPNADDFFRVAGL